MKISFESPQHEVVEPGVVHMHIRFRPANFTGILIVLLLHAILIYFLWTMQILHTKKGDQGRAAESLVYLPQTQASPAKAKAESQPKTAPKKTLQASQRPAITARPRQLPTTDSPVPAEPPPPAPVVAKAEPEMDMMAMINAAREKRRAQEDTAASENQAAARAARGPTPQQIAEMNVRHSMQKAAGGTNGVFQIINMSTRVGTFSFRGWKANAGNSWKQVIEVDAGLGGNLQLAMVRRMIDIIRSHYQGDFNWESQYLGRVVRLSARMEDSAGLEEFMMKEFFH